jgi:hypothetical protein
MSELTLSEAKEKVKNQEESITKIIDPNDLIHQDVESWDNVDIDKLKDELYGSIGDAWTYPHSHPYASMIESIAVNQFVEDMQRIPFEHLNPEIFKGPEDANVEGYWLYDQSREEVRNVVYEWKDDIEFFHEYEDNVRMEIDSAILDARIEDLE